MKTPSLAGCLAATPGACLLLERALVMLRHRFPASRLLAGLANQCTAASLMRHPGGGTRVAVLPGGAKLAVLLQDGWHRGIYYRGEYEPETTAFVLGFVRPGDTVLDVGANAGYFSCLAASRGATVHAFEPNPVLVQHLELTRRLNDFGDRFFICAAAVSAHDGLGELHLSPDPLNSGLSSLLPLEHLGAAGTVRVPTVTLDSYCQAHGVESIRLLKIDVEGAEGAVLEGAAEVLGQVRPEAIVCELGGFRDGCRPADVLAALAAAGYSPFSLTRRGLAPFAEDVSSIADVVAWQRNLCFLREGQVRSVPPTPPSERDAA